MPPFGTFSPGAALARAWVAGLYYYTVLQGACYPQAVQGHFKATVYYPASGSVALFLHPPPRCSRSWNDAWCHLFRLSYYSKLGKTQKYVFLFISVG